jgi:hypothetical protein
MVKKNAKKKPRKRKVELKLDVNQMAAQIVKKVTD